MLPPIIIKYSQLQGYYVVAAQAIPALTLICEYVGQVFTHKQVHEREDYRKNDSIMEIICNDEDSLYIIPVNKSNVGRFFNGINNRSL